MIAAPSTAPHPAAQPARRGDPRDSVMLAMAIFLGTELMFFGGLVSAYLVVRGGALRWPPLGQPRLPVEATAFNTALLLASAVALVAGYRGTSREPTAARGPRWLTLAALLGAAFVALQGSEWVGLVRYGLTMTSSPYGSFFYLIVGAHALHVVAALVVLALATVHAWRGTVGAPLLWAASAFWLFVVGLWPILYVLVYLV